MSETNGLRPGYDWDTAGKRGLYSGRGFCFVWLLYFVAGLHGSRGVAVRRVCGAVF